VATIVTRDTGASAKGSALTNTEMDTNFINLNEDKYESGDNIDVADVTISGDIVASIGTTDAAAGTTQGGATLLSKTFNIVTTATNNQGIKLPTAEEGLLYTIINATSVSVKIYPNTSGTINSGSINTAITIPAGTSSKLVGTSSSNWNTMVETIVYDSSGNRLN